MINRTAVVASKSGLHARPAALFVKAAAESAVPVMISVDGKAPVAAASMLQVMTLGVKQGDTVVLSAEDGAETSLDALVELLETDLDA
ncbi:Phosphocarrier protein HPr [Nocardia otitidiscaviarum]|uniref:Phosphocarrier protein HPr n=1 Tax=Nocardia otitidiscaviarum TaxID=1823 RepID=A0A378YWF6_9NOCA|nr:MULTISPECIES: HPr family phosphocarrier protein [Nocardia]MBF6180897.1 HPr family phosphocarrier protein [Nocardia otitidiscaviarum]MBF6237442.1 HPr family phosphocarrier protein [Nocardia otitidiscaviarum]MCP9625008.1 HPr family phosphocarrier protein [Nocardia otitidiscaviarum]QDP80113.1 HPr family phosphocarrier protein [Nocardia otitidiscaviarum]SUA81103.1 Phosphocarrier protein HPr [Nocardia otitidiscaviarum]